MKIQTLELNEDQILDEHDHESSFVRRQFQETPTNKQIAFDWTYGVGVPLICVAADPIVFVEDGFLPGFSVFAHILSAVSIFSMASWLLWGKRLGWLGAPLGGLFL